jgi:hypothetical protein
MSTVQNIIDHIKPRIGEYTDIYWAINNAVRTVAKRLFILESDLIKTGFELTYAIEESYKNIATSYDDFWGLADRPYQNGESYPLLPVPDRSKILAYKPKVHDSDQGSLSYATNDFTDDGQDFSDWDGGNYIYKLVVTNSDATVSWGYIGGYEAADVTTANIYQDRDYDTAGWLGTSPVGKTPSSYEIQSQAVGTPKYFELKGTVLHIYPCDDEELIIYGDYFAKPTELDDTTDTMPYSELFDDVIEEYVVKIVRSGFSGADKKSDPKLLRYFTWKAVDEILATRSQIYPRSFSA